DRARWHQHFAADRQALGRTDLLAEFETRGDPRIVSADQLFFAATDDPVFVEEIDRVDDLVLQEGPDIHHVADAAAADQGHARIHARVSAVVADVADQADGFALFPTRPVHERKILSSETKELEPPPGLSTCGKTAKTFSFRALEATKSW